MERVLWLDSNTSKTGPQCYPWTLPSFPLLQKKAASKVILLETKELKSAKQADQRVKKESNFDGSGVVVVGKIGDVYGVEIDQIAMHQNKRNFNQEIRNNRQEMKLN